MIVQLLNHDAATKTIGLVSYNIWIVEAKQLCNRNASPRHIITT